MKGYCSELNCNNAFGQSGTVDILLSDIASMNLEAGALRFSDYP